MVYLALQQLNKLVHFPAIGNVGVPFTLTLQDIYGYNPALF